MASPVTQIPTSFALRTCCQRGGHPTGIEDAIKITTRCLSGVGVLVTECLDVRPSFVRFFQPLGGIEGFL
jgi:hypothetical protein